MVKKANEALSKNAALEHERLTSLINSMGDGVIALDENQKVLFYNGAALNVLDKNEEITDKYISTIINLVDKNNQHVDLTELIKQANTAVYYRDYKIVYSDNSFVNLYLSIAPVRLGYGHKGTRGYVLLLRDITREKSLEEERDEFISVVSHELRTPITIAEGNISNAQMIVEKGGSKEQIQDALRQAHDQTVFLSGMINDLSTLSRAQRGKLVVDIESINVYELINDLTQNYKPDADKKNLKINTELDPSLELLQSSRLYVREILQNFITNAIKYTEKGHITIGAKNKKTGILFYVSDTGIGLSKNDKEQVFDKFFRSEDFRTRQNSGTGLGLYVTQKLANLLHAEIDLESELNKGSTFYIYIPNLK